jgi:hypothetical protein
MLGVVARTAFSALIAWGTFQLFGFEIAVLVMLVLIFSEVGGVLAVVDKVRR